MVAAESVPAPNDRADATRAPMPRPYAPERVVVPQTTPWAAEYPFTSRWLNVAAAGQPPLWMHYLDEGPRDAPVLIMVHGNPSWSFYWRRMVTALRGTYRCIVPDHIGCGLSDRPQQWGFRLADHVDGLTTLVDALDVKRFSLIVHDWGGAIGMGLATERPDALVSSVVTNTAAFLSQDIPPSIASIRIPVFGKIAVLYFNAFAGAATFRAVERKMTPVVKQGFLAPYGTPNDRIATLRFVEDIPLQPSHPSYARLARIEQRLPLLADKPMLLLWGERDFCFTPKFRARWQQLFPRADVEPYADAGHYVLEDAHERLIPRAAAFLNGHAR